MKSLYASNVTSMLCKGKRKLSNSESAVMKKECVLETPSFFLRGTWRSGSSLETVRGLRFRANLPKIGELFRKYF